VLYVAVREDRDVREHLVIDEFIGCRHLRRAVEQQHAPEALVVDQHDVLIRRARAHEDLIGVIRDAYGRRERFVHPLVHRLAARYRHYTRPRRITSMATRRGANASSNTSMQRSGRACPHMKMSSAA